MPRRKTPILMLVYVSSIALIGCGSPQPPEVTEGDTAPQFVATGIDGRKINFPISDNDKPSVVLMWATWCPYCKVLMPRLDEIRSDYAELGVEVIAINAKERGRGDPERFVREAGWDFVTIVDEGNRLAEIYNVDYLPGLFVVDGRGTIVYRRKWTELPAGQEVADLWSNQVRDVLDDQLDL